MTDGVFAPDGSFIALPALDDEPFEKLWQRKVFDLLARITILSMGDDDDDDDGDD